jgi:tetratricopeptide (TPR) repeat protein/O-antigen ligase
VVALLLVYNTFVGTITYNVPLLYRRLLMRPLYLGLFALWLIGLLRRKRPFPRSPLDTPLLLLGGIVLGATAFSIEPRLSLEDIPLYFNYVMVYYLVVDRLRAGWSVSVFLKGLLLTTGVICAVGGLEYLAWYAGALTSGQGWWSIGGWRNPLPPILYRPSLALFNPNILASLLAMVLPVGVAVAVTARSRWVRANAIVLVLLNGLVLLLSFSRGGLLAAWAGLAALALLAASRCRPLSRSGNSAVRWPRLLIVAGLFVVVAVALILSPAAQSLWRPYTTQFRLEIWEGALQIIRDHPLIGTGPRTFGAAVLRYPIPAEFIFQATPAANSAHNVLLHAGAGIGVVGALTVLWIALWVIRAGYRQTRQLSFRQAFLIGGVLSGLLAFGVHSALDNMLAVPSVMVPVIVMAAICTVRPGEHLLPSHSLLTPRRALLLTAAVAGWIAWSLYGLARFENVATAAGAGQWPVAAERFETLPAGALPTSLQHFQRGLIYGKLALDEPDDGALQVAIEAHQTGLTMMPEYLPGRANLAALYWRSGDVDGARRELQAVAARAGRTEVASLYWLNLGLLLEQQGDDVAAVSAYAQAVAANPRLAGSIYWQENDWRRDHRPSIRERAETQIEQVDDPAVVIVRRAQLAYSSGDLDQALVLSRESVTIADSPAVRTLLCESLSALGRYEEAIVALAEADGASPRLSVEAYLCRGRANWLLGREEAAALDLRTAAFLGLNRAQYYLGQIALSEGDAESALAFYRASLSDPPNLLKANQLYDLIVYRQGGILENNLLPLVALPPSTSVAEIYLQLADLYARGGDVAAARQSCQRLLDLSAGYQPAVEKLESLNP